ncbi:Uma2 family endonuclease [Sporomusa termitida]|uniref:Restriction endonuclease n=1 Tax=Sporomusa termitida TaxID=2377 RepID=A0A517DVT1_9FIRM|nr:Uma2 family endonuclease [Sporomusa termitida]QDR81469.1 Putative restriction endonuclease [Sporomusa termitida]
MGKSAIKYTYADYLAWPENEHWELIDGTAYAMTPAPNRQHQEISRNLLVEFAVYLKDKKCQVYAAPFDVRLPQKNENENNATTVVQPDITVVCDADKLDAAGCKGSPDLIIEILSRSTASHDVIRKRKIYEASGVFEYWIVDPAHQIITRFYMNEELSEYRKAEYFGREGIIAPIVLPELQIMLEDVFRSSILE